MAASGPLPKDVRGERHGARSPVDDSLAVVVTMPSTPATCPDPPADLGPAGLATWDGALASAPWICNPAAVESLAELAYLADEMAGLRDEIRVRGRRSIGSMGQEVEAPAVKALRAAEHSRSKLRAELGLGPMHAARLGVSVRALTPRATSPFEQLIERRAG